MRILVTGREGQLARGLLDRAAEWPHLSVEALGRPDLDLETPGSARAAILRAAPDLVINAAAYTAVDQAEDEAERAFRVNGDAAGEIAQAAAEVGASIIHVSTDYVFDGTAPASYRETDRTNPIGVYGRSKLEGERQVATANPRHLIVRTAWVYSPWGKNFVRTMLNLADSRSELNVVGDQVGNPTSALDLAGALLQAGSRASDDDWSHFGTYHFCGADEMSWARFAEQIMSVSRHLSGPCARIQAISSSEWPTRAARPANSRLSSLTFAERFEYAPARLDQALPPVVERLIARSPATKAGSAGQATTSNRQ